MEFNTEIAKQVLEILTFATENKHSDFYRSKYGNAKYPRVITFEQFKKIPYLEKNDILKESFDKRIFVSKESVGRYTFSSGTSQKNKITIIPHYSASNPLQHSASHLEHGEMVLRNLNLSKLLILWPIASSAFQRNMAISRNGIVKIPGDTYNLAYSASLVKNLGIEAFTTTTTILDFFIQHLINAGVNLSSIKWIALGGEYCSNLKFSYLKKVFPNAFFSFRYGSSESGARGYRCEHLSQKSPNIFHPTPYLFMEIDEPDDEGYGELIITTLTKKPFPLIRYKTGDVVSISKKTCACGNNYIINIGGRKELDVLKISGITLHTQAIETSVDAAKEFIEPQFQMHVFEKTINNTIKIQLEIHVCLKNFYCNMKDNPHFMENLSVVLAKNLRVSQKSFLVDLIEQGLFLPLNVKVLNQRDTHFKSRNIISHIL